MTRPNNCKNSLFVRVYKRKLRRQRSDPMRKTTLKQRWSGRAIMWYHASFQDRFQNILNALKDFDEVTLLLECTESMSGFIVGPCLKTDILALNKLWTPDHPDEVLLMSQHGAWQLDSNHKIIVTRHPVEDFWTLCVESRNFWAQFYCDNPNQKTVTGLSLDFIY